MLLVGFDRPNRGCFKVVIGKVSEECLEKVVNRLWGG